MKRFTLLSVLSILALGVWAAGDQPLTTPHLHQAMSGGSMVYHPLINRVPVHLAFDPSISRNGNLQKVTVGSAGNLLTVFNANCHQIHVDNSLNTVVFIHRSDTTSLFVGSNLGQYRYDISKNGGSTFSINNGPLNKLANNQDYSARYPQVMIQKSAGVTMADSAYLTFIGVWHNGLATNAVWEGSSYGTIQIGDTSKRFETRDSIFGGGVAYLHSTMCKAGQNHYFTLNRRLRQYSSTLSESTGMILGRGTWNDATHRISWTYDTLAFGVVPTTLPTASTSTGSKYTPISEGTISFDPSGKYGWIMYDADLVDDNFFQQQPILYKSVDSGATWTGPISLRLYDIPGMKESFQLNSTSSKDITTSFFSSTQVVVDSAGNPHIFGVVATGDTTSANAYTYRPYGPKGLFDVHYNAANSVTCQWKATFLANINAIEGQYISFDNTSDAARDDNRVQVSRSDDGSKLFVLWNDTDSGVVRAILAQNTTSVVPINNHPNLFGMGIDPFLNKITDIKNFTAGDSLFGGPVAFTGVYVEEQGVKGSFYPVVSQNCFSNAGTFNIPVVLTEPDYLHPKSKSSLPPARFYYAQNINFVNADFKTKYDAEIITMTALDSSSNPAHDTVFVVRGKKYSPPIVTAIDPCTGAAITNIFGTNNVPTDGSGNTNTAGSYYGKWTAIGLAGDSQTYQQTVIVGDTPRPYIYYTRQTNRRFTFFGDSSKNNPTTYDWNFGDGSAHNASINPAAKTYPVTVGPRTVTLCVSNVNFPGFGTKCTSMIVQVTTGIEEPAFADQIVVYPNPTSAEITVELPSGLNTDTKIEIYDMSGRKVSTDKTIKANNLTGTFNLSELSTGNYILRLMSNGGAAQKRITITK